MFALAKSGWKFLSVCFLFLFFGPSVALHAQTTSLPSGTIVNSYARVISISSTSVQLSSSAGFSANSRAVIVQMKGASVNRSDSSTHGDIGTYGTAGRFEYVKIVSVSGNVVTLSASPGVSFSTSGLVQLVSVPVYDNLTLSQNIIPKTWRSEERRVGKECRSRWSRDH